MREQECVVVYASVAVLPEAVAAAVPADASIDEAFHHIVSHLDAAVATGGDDTRRRVDLIDRELSGQVQYLNVAPGRPVELVAPGTPVGDMAVPHEVVDDGGATRTVKAVFAEAQAHARVG